MKIKVTKSKAEGKVKAPASKSEAHRAMFTAALSTGRSKLTNFGLNKDISQSVKALKYLGAEISVSPFEICINGGLKSENSEKPIVIDCGESGTTARFVTAIAAATPGSRIITASDRMKHRPMLELLTALREIGAGIEEMDRPGYLPLRVTGRQLTGGKISIDGNRSSQYASALLLISPLTAKGLDLTVKNPRSSPYIRLTSEIMRKFGIRVEGSANTWKVENNQEYCPQEFRIGGDWSSASYFTAAAALTDGHVTVTGLDPASSQADSVFPQILEKLGCIVEVTGDSITVEVKGKLSGGSFDMGDYPDLVPSLAILSGNAKKPIKITNVSHLRDKETDRLETVSKNLERLGLKTEVTTGSLTVHPGFFSGGKIDAANDHRIAMSFAVAAMAASGPVEIEGFDAIAKSYPGFLQDFKKINGKISET